MSIFDVISISCVNGSYGLMDPYSPVNMHTFRMLKRNYSSFSRISVPFQLPPKKKSGSFVKSLKQAMKVKKNADTFVIPAPAGGSERSETPIQVVRNILKRLDRSLAGLLISRFRGNDNPCLFDSCIQYLLPVFNVNTNEPKNIIMIQQ